MVLRQRSITALYAGRGAASGKKAVPGSCWQRAIPRHADDRLHARESAPLRGGWKRGEQKQAVGRSRGGRNTKIHALADVKGRLIAILLTTGEARDCPVAERLVRRVKPSFQIAATGNNRSASASVSTSCAGAEGVQEVKGFQVYRNPLRRAGTKLSGLCLPRRCSCMVLALFTETGVHWSRTGASMLAKFIYDRALGQITSAQ
jgi:hypothetical protein